MTGKIILAVLIIVPMWVLYFGGLWYANRPPRRK